jgi:SHS2 domain-containing protein
MTYKFLEHTADIKIVAQDSTIEKAFSSSALALREVMFDFEKIKVAGEQSKIISIEGKDIESLFYNFLEEFIYLLDAEDFILSEIEDIEIAQDEDTLSFNLSAKLLGDKASKYKFTNKVKAITYNDMLIQNEKIGKGKLAKDNFKIQFVLDV